MTEQGKAEQPASGQAAPEQANRLPKLIELAWGLRETGKRGPRPGLSLEQIIDAGIAVADEGGLAAVSMSRVAQRLGFTTMSLYRYVDSKDDLIALMRDRAIGEPPEPVPGEGWRAGLERWTRAQVEQGHGHRWWVDIPVPATITMPHALGWLEAGLATMSDTGLSHLDKASVTLMLASQALADLRLAQDLLATDPADYSEQMTHLARVLDRDRFPGVTALLAAGAFEDDSVGSGDSLTFALERILDGVQLLIDRQAAAQDGAS
jgi:AcrR family transcriptional regulator